MDGLQTFENGYALIIGVGADLPMTVVDATAIRDIIVDPQRAAYNENNVTLLTEANATKKAISDAFDDLIGKVKKDDTVIVYYSGHGGFDEASGEYYLVPYGFNVDNRKDTGISAAEFTGKINRIRSQKLVVFLDCCHAAGMADDQDAPDAAASEKSVVSASLPENLKSTDFDVKAPTDLISTLGRGSGRFFISSSRENEYSLAASPYSIFTESLINALSGAGTKENTGGYAKIFEVTGYILDSVPKRRTDFPPYKEVQNPIVNYVDKATNFPLCYYAGGRTKNPFQPDAPPVARDEPPSPSRVIYGVIYEKTKSGARQPVREAKVKIPTLADSAVHTNIDGDFILTNVPEKTKVIDVHWNDQIYSLPISADETYTLEKKFVKNFSLLETLFKLLEILIKNNFWQKAIILLIGLFLFALLIGYIVTDPNTINGSPPIQFIVMVLTALITSVVTFLLVPPKAKHRNLAITTSTGFITVLMYLFIQFVSQTVTIVGYVVNKADGTPVSGALVTLLKRNQEAPKTQEDGKFTFENVRSDENEINIFAFNKNYTKIKLNREKRYEIEKPTPTPTPIENYKRHGSEVWEELKDPVKIKACREDCPNYVDYITKDYSFQFFRLKLTNVAHNTHPIFFVRSGLFPESVGAKICHAQGTIEDKDSFERIENEYKDKLRLFKVKPLSNLINGKVSFCIALPPKIPSLTKDNWKVETWSGNE